MAIVNKPNTFSGNTTISSSEINSNFDTLYNEFNGSISAANLADDAVTAAKLADNAVVAANISSDSVTATKIDWATTGANGGIWWEELGRTTLSGAGDTISVTSIPARKYLRIQFIAIPSGVLDVIMQFNGDTGNNYAFRYATNDGADASSTSTGNFSMNADSSATLKTGVMDVINITAQEKLVVAELMGASTAGAGSTPVRRVLRGKWANTAAQITRVDLVNAGGGDLAIGSEVVVLGHN